MLAILITLAIFFGRLKYLESLMEAIPSCSAAMYKTSNVPQSERIQDACNHPQRSVDQKGSAKVTLARIRFSLCMVVEGNNLPVFHEIMAQNPELASYLTDGNCLSILSSAISHGYQEMSLALLQKYNAPVVQMNVALASIYPMTAFGLEVLQCKKLTLMKELLLLGADPNIPCLDDMDYLNMTPLTVLVQNGGEGDVLEKISLLLMHGADPLLTPNRSPLYLVHFAKNPQIRSLILRYIFNASVMKNGLLLFLSSQNIAFKDPFWAFIYPLYLRILTEESWKRALMQVAVNMQELQRFRRDRTGP